MKRWTYTMRRWTLNADPRITLRGEKKACRVYVEEVPHYGGRYLPFPEAERYALHIAKYYAREASDA